MVHRGTMAPSGRANAGRAVCQLSRALAVLGTGAALAAAAITCTDARLTAPVRAGAGLQLAIAPSFETLPAGAPSIDLSKIRGVLVGLNGDSVVVEALFQGDSAVLVFKVSFTGQQGVFQLSLTAYDTSGQVAFSGIDTIRVTPGENPPVQPTHPLQYSAPDAAVTTLHVVPSAVQLKAGQSGNLAVTGTNAAGQPIAPIRVGWTSRDPAVVAVDANGVATAGPFEGVTWIVARTATNVADSARVSVHAPVDSVSIAPGTATVIRGDSVRLVPSLLDAGHHPITNRQPAWSSSAPAIATVNDSGWVTGVSLGAATITAISEGKRATADVTVVSPVDSVRLSPSPVSFAALTARQQITVTAVPRADVAAARVAGLAVHWQTSDPHVVAVDTAGVATATGNGGALITATIDGVAAVDTVTVTQVAVRLRITPPNTGVAGIRGQRQFAVIAADAMGQPVPSSLVHWSSTDPSIATVDDTGLVTAASVGRTGIVAASGALADTGYFTVSQVPYVVVASFAPETLSLGTPQQIVSSVLDYSFQPIPGAPVAFASLQPAVASVSSAGVVTPIAAGAGAVAVSSGLARPDTVRFIVQVPVGGPGALVLNLTTAEKLPHGTQQFSIVAGNPGPYVWSVNGVVGGDSTYGTVDTTGFYTAPAAVPTPSSFPVCARRRAAPADSACATVTINPVPTAGGDVVVINDLNVFDNTAAADPNNRLFYRNLVNFSGAGSRAAGTKVLMFRGHGPACSSECSAASGWSTFESTMASQGYTVIDGDDRSTPLTSIDPSVKLLVLVLPTQSFSWAEINAIKQFSGEGGRVLFDGEWDGYYGAGIAVENNFLADMGAVMRNVSGAVDCGYTVIPGSAIHAHQITSGLTDLTVACLSLVHLGPNDFSLIDYDATNRLALAAVAKVDLTPLLPPANRAVPMSDRSIAPSPAPRNPNVHSWGPGPAPTKRPAPR